jgi:hypothetical protein
MELSHVTSIQQIFEIWKSLHVTSHRQRQREQANTIREIKAKYTYLLHIAIWYSFKQNTSIHNALPLSTSFIFTNIIIFSCLPT